MRKSVINRLSKSTLLCVAGLSLLVGGCRSSTVRASASGIPAAVVQQGDVQIKVQTTGTLDSTNTRIVAAPPVGGGALQIISLARTGSTVHRDDVILAFDPSQQEYNLAQARSDLAQAEEEIVKAKADAAVQTAQDKTALLKAKFAVRRAELDVSKNELLSEIDAKKNQLALDQAKRALAQLRQDIQSHSSSNQAGISLSEEKRNKARLAMQQAQQNIGNMQVKSPIDGMMVIHGNQQSTGGFFFNGMTLPDYQPGDQVSPGATIAEVVDISKMEISAQIPEGDRPFLKAGDGAVVSVDALPGEDLAGKVSSVAGAANREFWEMDSQRKFDLKVVFNRSDPRLRPGFSANMTLLGDNVSHVCFIPREAIFLKNGKTIVYTKQSGGWVSREVKVRAFSEGRALLENLGAGTVVALVDPEKQSSGASRPSAAGPALGKGSL